MGTRLGVCVAMAAGPVGLIQCGLAGPQSAPGSILVVYSSGEILITSVSSGNSWINQPTRIRSLLGSGRENWRHLLHRNSTEIKS
ncbi:UNVERIFIED_CONTAM: hypothetical protein FKN15_038148 [Acipenser sinensis]